MFRLVLVAALLALGCETETVDCDCVIPPRFVVHLPPDRLMDYAGASFVGDGCGSEMTSTADGGVDLVIHGKGTCKVTVLFKSSPPVETSASFRFVEGCCGDGGP